ncbi:MAG: PLP-dependent aminotransferase family protein [Candidatus Eremiobacteraeota bacterium]|nr:PLP-dependent aminotransferase family protein [Candidatus Eremiobacteraeota bacterium]MBC5826539.1 PLP-dependent aminotransferase family protein [Candidatus Eremiobacteraeota bacterium]
MALRVSQEPLYLIKSAPLKEHGPLYLQVAETISGLIADGSLPRGSVMPRVRDLAHGLNVSIVTAAHAYRVLGEKGLLAGRPGVGTFVAELPTRHADPPSPDARSLAWQEAFVRHKGPSNLAYIYRLPHSCAHATWSFFSVPSHGGELLSPTKRAMKRIALDAEIAACHPTDTQGLPELRAAIATHLHEEGIEAGADRVLVTNSYEETLVLALLAFCHEGDCVAMEDPAQFCLVDAVRLRGIRVTGVPMDDKGMRTDVLDSIAAREPIRMVVVTPRAQNPTGVEMAPARRHHLLEMAGRHNWLIFECDPFAPLTYRGRPQPPLFCADRDGRVIYTRPVSRGLLMNLGATVATGRILEQLVHAKDIIDRGSDVFLQLVLKRLFEGGSISRQDAQMRRQWGDQMAALLGALDRAMPSVLRWTRPRGGGSVWVTMPEGCSAEALLSRCLDSGISFIPGRAFSVTDRHDRCFRLAIGSMPPAQIMEGVKRLAPLVAQYVNESQRGRARSPISRVS